MENQLDTLLSRQCNGVWNKGALLARYVLSEHTLVDSYSSDFLFGTIVQDSSNQSEIVMIKLYCCSPNYCSVYPLNMERSWV